MPDNLAEQLDYPLFPKPPILDTVPVTAEIESEETSDEVPVMVAKIEPLA